MKKSVQRIFLALAVTFAVAAPVAPAELPVIDLSAGIHVIHAEVANTMSGRSQGLMFRKNLSPNHGMLFVFDVTDRHCMWMKNTLIPLSVAFIDERGVILNIEDMQPQTEDTHCAVRPARYALEMSLNWFRQRGLGADTMLKGVEKAPGPQ
jgi:uncharacterized membrane protein (UPF0127 family)